VWCGRPLEFLDQEWRSYGTRAQNDTRLSLLSHSPLFILPDQSLYIVKYIYAIYVWHICIYIYIYTHIYGSVQYVYEVSLLPNNNASATFLRKSGAVRGVDWIFMKVEEIQQDATVGRYLFNPKLRYMFRTSIAPIIST